MIISTEQLVMKYSEYKSPHHKIQSMVKRGELVPLKRGLYETDRHTAGYMLANVLYGPSYLSFEYALSYYGMIPERVTVYTSATCSKRRKKEFQNQFGVYTYQDVPTAVYPHGYTRIEADPYPYLIADREKALCDELSILSPIRGRKAFEEYLFEGMRLDEDIFDELDSERLKTLAGLYHRTNLEQLIRLIDRGGGYNE